MKEIKQSPVLESILKTNAEKKSLSYIKSQSQDVLQHSNLQSGSWGSGVDHRSSQESEISHSVMPYPIERVGDERVWNNWRTSIERARLNGDVSPFRGNNNRPQNRNVQTLPPRENRTSELRRLKTALTTSCRESQVPMGRPVIPEISQLLKSLPMSNFGIKIDNRKVDCPKSARHSGNLPSRDLSDGMSDTKSRDSRMSDSYATFRPSHMRRNSGRDNQAAVSPRSYPGQPLSSRRSALQKRDISRQSSSTARYNPSLASLLDDFERGRRSNQNDHDDLSSRGGHSYLLKVKPQQSRVPQNPQSVRRPESARDLRDYQRNDYRIDQRNDYINDRSRQGSIVSSTSTKPSRHHGTPPAFLIEQLRGRSGRYSLTKPDHQQSHDSDQLQRHDLHKHELPGTRMSDSNVVLNSSSGYAVRATGLLRRNRNADRSPLPVNDVPASRPRKDSDNNSLVMDVPNIKESQLDKERRRHRQQQLESPHLGLKVENHTQYSRSVEYTRKKEEPVTTSEAIHSSASADKVGGIHACHVLHQNSTHTSMSGGSGDQQGRDNDELLELFDLLESFTLAKTSPEVHTKAGYLMNRLRCVLTSSSKVNEVAFFLPIKNY